MTWVLGALVLGLGLLLLFLRLTQAHGTGPSTAEFRELVANMQAFFGVGTQPLEITGPARLPSVRWFWGMAMLLPIGGIAVALRRRLQQRSRSKRS